MIGKVFYQISPLIVFLVFFCSSTDLVSLKFKDKSENILVKRGDLKKFAYFIPKLKECKDQIINLEDMEYSKFEIILFALKGKNDRDLKLFDIIYGMSIIEALECKNSEEFLLFFANNITFESTKVEEFESFFRVYNAVHGISNENFNSFLRFLALRIINIQQYSLILSRDKIILQCRNKVGLVRLFDNFHNKVLILPIDVVLMAFREVSNSITNTHSIESIINNYQEKLLVKILLLLIFSKRKPTLLSLECSIVGCKRMFLPLSLHLNGLIKFFNYNLLNTSITILRFENCSLDNSINTFINLFKYISSLEVMKCSFSAFFLSLMSNTQFLPEYLSELCIETPLLDNKDVFSLSPLKDFRCLQIFSIFCSNFNELFNLSLLNFTNSEIKYLEIDINANSHLEQLSNLRELKHLFCIVFHVYLTDTNLMQHFITFFNFALKTLVNIARFELNIKAGILFSSAIEVFNAKKLFKIYLTGVIFTYLQVGQISPLSIYLKNIYFLDFELKQSSEKVYLCSIPNILEIPPKILTIFTEKYSLENSLEDLQLEFSKHAIYNLVVKLNLNACKSITITNFTEAHLQIAKKFFKMCKFQCLSSIVVKKSSCLDKLLLLIDLKSIINLEIHNCVDISANDFLPTLFWKCNSLESFIVVGKVRLSLKDIQAFRWLKHLEKLELEDAEISVEGFNQLQKIKKDLSSLVGVSLELPEGTMLFFN